MSTGDIVQIGQRKLVLNEQPKQFYLDGVLSENDGRWWIATALPPAREEKRLIHSEFDRLTAFSLSTIEPSA